MPVRCATHYESSVHCIKAIILRSVASAIIPRIRAAQGEASLMQQSAASDDFLGFLNFFGSHTLDKNGPGSRPGRPLAASGGCAPGP
eukprot:360436-Chlamydomonas_euryale.AAC.1